jgi:hypothetical protein
VKETTSPTHWCADSTCSFTTVAASKKGLKLAGDRHYAETGHEKLVRIRRDEEPQELVF